MDGTCAVRLTRRYESGPEEVWRALTEPESLARWLGAPDVRLRALEPGRVLELELPGSVARIEFTAEGGTTVLVLDHRALPAAVGMRFLRQWTSALGRFRAEVAA